MNLDGIKHLTIGELKPLLELEHMTIPDAMPHVSTFAQEHGLNNRQTLNAYCVARKIYRHDKETA